VNFSAILFLYGGQLIKRLGFDVVIEEFVEGTRAFD
jgi:hypothetical protein